MSNFYPGPHHRRRCALVVLMLTALTVPAISSIIVAPTDPNIRYSGRFDFSDPQTPRFSWPGTTISFRFTGQACSVILHEGDSSWYNVVIDDSLVKTFLARTSADTYSVAQGLPAGGHTLTLYKKTESEYNPVTFGGVVLSDAGALQALPARLDRRIEFIGDSHTAGLGARGSFTAQGGTVWASCTYGVADAYLSYGAVTGRYFGADDRITAVSGKGLVNNHSEPGRTSAVPFPAYFTRTLTSSALPAWNFSSWTPQVAVVNIGTNDFAQCFEDRTTIADQTVFKTAYHAFLDSVRLKYPGVKLVLVGPLDTCGCRDSTRKVVKAVYDEEKSRGKTDISYLAYPAIGNRDFVCCHPAVAFHQKLADALIPIIAASTGWSKAAASPHQRAAPVLRDARFVMESTPAGAVTIRVTGGMGVRGMELLDSTGRVVKTWAQVTGGSVTWSSAETVNGVYTVRAILDSKTKIEGRVVVRKQL